MPVTTLDPSTALIIVDLQRGVVAMPTAAPIGPVVERARALADAFRRHGLPVVLVNVTGFAPGRTEQPRRMVGIPDGWAELVPELGAAPTDIRVTKQSWSAFRDTGLEERLRGVAVTQVVIVGVSTSAGVESTARQAHEAGFHVVFAVDAMTDLNPESHQHSLTRIFPRLGETGTTADILALLEHRSA